MKLKPVLKIVLSLSILLGFTTFYVKALTIAGPSMAPTYLYGDKLIANYAAYDLKLPFSDIVLAKTGEPSRGEAIVYFDIPKGVIAVKRVIGVPGDTVQLKQNVLFVNDKAIKQVEKDLVTYQALPSKNDVGKVVVSELYGTRDYLVTYTPGRSSKATSEPVLVQPGQYFILGDNRDNSADSRFIGLISRSQIKAKVVGML